TRSSLPLMILGLGILAAGRAAGPTTQWRIVAVCLLAFVPLQFRSFWSDYFSDYRVRSAFWLGGNIRGALEALIDDAGPDTPAVYFSTLKSASGQVDGRDQYMGAYWRFYLAKHHREDLLARTKPFAPEAIATTAAGSLVLANVGDPGIEALVGHGKLRPLETISELDGRAFFLI